MLDVVEALEGPIAPMECFHSEREGRVLCSHEADARPRLRDEAALDPGPRRRDQGARRAPRSPTWSSSPGRSPRPPRWPNRSPERPPTDFQPTTNWRPMADLEIRNLHVSAEDKEILKGLDLEVSKGEVHALMGPNGSGKSTLANAIMGHPALEVTEGEIFFEGEDITEADPEERSRIGPVHGLPVPGRDPRRHRRQVPADGDQRPPRGARRAPDQPQGLPPRDRGGDGAGRHPARVLEPLRQRRLLRRREEAAGDPAAGDAAAEDRGPRRDRLRPRHRRAAGRRRRRQPLRRPRHGRPDHHPLPAHPAPGRARLRPRHVRRADRQGGRPRAGRPSSRRRATAGSARRSRHCEPEPDRRSRPRHRRPA